MKQNLKQSQFITNLLDWTISALIGAALAALMIGMIFAASLQHADRIEALAAMEVGE